MRKEIVECTCDRCGAKIDPVQFSTYLGVSLDVPKITGSQIDLCYKCGVGLLEYLGGRWLEYIEYYPKAFT